MNARGLLPRARATSLIIQAIIRHGRLDGQRRWHGGWNPTRCVLNNLPKHSRAQRIRSPHWSLWVIRYVVTRCLHGLLEPMCFAPIWAQVELRKCLFTRQSTIHLPRYCRSTIHTSARMSTNRVRRCTGEMFQQTRLKGQLTLSCLVACVAQSRRVLSVYPRFAIPLFLPSILSSFRAYPRFFPTISHCCVHIFLFVSFLLIVLFFILHILNIRYIWKRVHVCVYTWAPSRSRI